MRAKLLNKYEEVTYEKLKRACEPNGAHVFPKVRVADTISLNGLDLSAHEFTYGLKSHFDFVVTDKDYFPLFSVEYDGRQHKIDGKQVQRDLVKNGICEKSNYPLLRINSRYLDREFRGLDLLTYFVDVWFLQEAFEEAQRNGAVPYELLKCGALSVAGLGRNHERKVCRSSYKTRGNSEFSRTR